MDQYNQTPTTQPVPVSPPSPAEVAPKPSLFLPIFLTFLITSLLFVGGYFGYQYLTKIQPATTAVVATPTPIPTAQPENPPTDWKTYTSPSQIISFQFPPSWSQSGNAMLNSPQKKILISVHEDQSMMNECMEETDTKTNNGLSLVYYSHIKGTEACSNPETWNQREIWITQESDNKFGPGIIYAYSADDTTALPLFSQILSTFKFVNNIPEDQEKQLGFIKSFSTQNNGFSLTIDYVEMISDDNQPNGYRLSNTNPKLRTFTISPNTKVIMQTYSHLPDGNFAYDQPISLQTLDSIFNSSSDKSTAYLREAPYWITIQNNQITEIKEQYLP